MQAANLCTICTRVYNIVLLKLPLKLVLHLVALYNVPLWFPNQFTVIDTHCSGVLVICDFLVIRSLMTTTVLVIIYICSGVRILSPYLSVPSVINALHMQELRFGICHTSCVAKA
jgi:hypothetical protein